MRTCNRPRRASIYLLVLGVAMIVSSIAVFSLTHVRTQRRILKQNSDRVQAEIIARTAIERGRLLIESDPDWRTNRPQGVWWSHAAGGDSGSVEAIDPIDGDFTNDETGSVLMTATGVFGSARQKVEVRLNTFLEPIAVLRDAAHFRDGFGVSSGATVTVNDASITTNGSIVSSGTINGDVECNTTLGGTYNGTVTTGQTWREAPDSDILNDFKSIATTIPDTGDWDKVLLTPNHNPFGATNSDGLYYLDAGGGELSISNARIVGTLVIEFSNANKKLNIKNSVHIAPFRTDYPTIITNGNIEIDLDSVGAPLSEASLGMNFNPAGAPYQGVTDTDQTDTYPNTLIGLIHTRSYATIKGSMQMSGCLIAEGGLGNNIAGTTTFTHDPQLISNPPIGYRIYQMRIESGSWRRVVDP